MNWQKSFTLIEIIIVIIILGIIAGLSLPRILNQLEVSKISEGVTVAGLYLDAQKRYSFDHDGYTPSCTNLDVSVLPKYFNVACQATDPVVTLTRKTGVYAISVRADTGAYSCSGCTVNQDRYIPD